MAIEFVDDSGDKNKKKDNGTPVLDNFSKDLIKYAEQGKLDPVIGRKKEILRIAQVLSRRKKTGTKLCARGKAAAKSKFKVYPSAYANGYAVSVCKGKIKGLDGQKRCSGAYC